MKTLIRASVYLSIFGILAANLAADTVTIMTDKTGQTLNVSQPFNVLTLTSGSTAPVTTTTTVSTTSTTSTTTDKSSTSYDFSLPLDTTVSTVPVNNIPVYSVSMPFDPSTLSSLYGSQSSNVVSNTAATTVPYTYQFDYSSLNYSNITYNTAPIDLKSAMLTQTAPTTTYQLPTVTANLPTIPTLPNTGPVFLGPVGGFANPEPSTILLFVSGLVGLGIWRRRHAA